MIVFDAKAPNLHRAASISSRCCLLQMKRLLARPARGPQSRWSRQTLLRLLFVATAAVVLAFIGWALADTAKIDNVVRVQVESDAVDYGQLANVLLANDTFPSDSLLSQLESYVIPNRKLRGDDWDQMNSLLNSSCPVKYNRLR